MERNSLKDFVKFANRMLMIQHPRDAGNFDLPKGDKQAASIIVSITRDHPTHVFAEMAYRC